MKYFVIFLIFIGFVGSAFALDDETLQFTGISLEEHYEIEILGLKDEYTVGEEYSFYFVILGYGYSCANHQVSYPDENGNIMSMGAEVLCAPGQSMHELKNNSLDGKRIFGNTGIKKSGTYTVTVTFEKPNKYYPTTISKEFRVVESTTENFNKLSPLKQIKLGVATDKIRCNEGLKFILKYDANPACVKSESILKLAERGWISETDEHSLLILKKVSESCTNDSPKERMANPLRYSNGTHIFSNLGCEWKKIGVYVGDDIPVIIKKESDPIIDSVWRTDEDYCQDWCDQEELYVMGCEQPILAHLTKYSNLFSEEFNGVYGIEDIGLPDGVSEEKLKECVDFIYEKRTSGQEKTTPEPDSFRSSEPSTKIEIVFGEPYKNGLVPVTTSEVTIFAEELEEITVWDFQLTGNFGENKRATWDEIPKEDRIWYQIINENSKDVINYSQGSPITAILADQHIYEMTCDMSSSVEGESAHPTTFPIKSGNYAIVARNSNIGIYPDTNGEYSIEFASIFPHYVRFLEDMGEIISEETQECDARWQIDGKPEMEHTAGYYTKMVFRIE